MAREDDSDSRSLGTTPQRVHFGGHRKTCRCALFSREKVNQKSSLGKYHLLLDLSYCLCRRAGCVRPVVAERYGALPARLR